TPAVLLAHGAGAGMSSPFVSFVHAELARAGYVAVKFNFPYAEARRRTPDPRPVLERCYRAVLDAVAADRALLPPWIAIGGKSLGGRPPSYLPLAAPPVGGVVFPGSPLRPARQLAHPRPDHLPSLPVPMPALPGPRPRPPGGAARAPRGPGPAARARARSAAARCLLPDSGRARARAPPPPTPRESRSVRRRPPASPRGPRRDTCLRARAGAPR